jgi:hypothetical protein
MKLYLSWLDYGLWWTTVILQWLALAFSMAGRLQHQAPRFLLYLCLLCVKSSVLVWVSLAYSYAAYFWCFYAGIAIETVLLLLVVHEIFRNTFDPLGVLPPGTIARLAGFLIVSTSIFITIGIWKPAQTSGWVDSLTALLRTIHRTVTFTVAIALWSLVMYARSLGIPWRSRIAGIAAGFLYCLSVESFVRAGQSFAPHAWFIWFDRSLSACFLVTLAMWIMATLRPAETAIELPTPEAMKKVSIVVAQMRSVAGAIRVVIKEKWSVESGE